LEPENLRFGGGVSQTIFNPFVAVVVVIAGLLIWLLPRNKVIVPFLVVSILIPIDQVVLVGIFHFSVLRILIFFGLIRVLCAKASSKSEIFSGGMNGIDTVVILLSIFTAVSGALLWRESQAVIYQLGDLYTALGLYFLLRFLVRDQEDVRRTIRVFAYIAAAVASLMVYEQATGQNLVYALLKGARASLLGSAMERDDRFRAAASFGHPILAGTFGAILLPLFFGLWWKYKQDRKYALLGMISATVISIAANSSTPLLGYIGGLIALCFWPLRKLMRPIRWGIVLTLVSLHLAMKAPVWHLISRIDLAGGSSSYHRYQLVNQCILHFKDWWLFGVKSTGEWGWDMWDTANQYVSTADHSGLLPLILFLAVFAYGFKYLGGARKAVEQDKKSALFLWSLGAALFANAVSFFGISYWDQTIVAWYALLAMIAAAALGAPEESTATVLTQEVPARLTMPLSSAYKSDAPKAPNSYGRMVTGRWSPKTTTK